MSSGVGVAWQGFEPQIPMLLTLGQVVILNILRETIWLCSYHIKHNENTTPDGFKGPIRIECSPRPWYTGLYTLGHTENDSQASIGRLNSMRKQRHSLVKLVGIQTGEQSLWTVDNVWTNSTTLTLSFIIP